MGGREEGGREGGAPRERPDGDPDLAGTRCARTRRGRCRRRLPGFRVESHKRQVRTIPQRSLFVAICSLGYAERLINICLRR